VLIGAVVVGVAALFGFMAMNTGPDEERQQALATKDAELEAELNATTVPIASTTEAPATTAAPATPSAYDVVDLTRFCRGGVAIGTLELRLTAAIADQDFSELRAIVQDRRAAWDADVADLVAGAPPILANDIELYRTGYSAYFDAVSSSSTMEQTYSKVDRMQLVKASNAAIEIGTQISNECE